MSEAKPLKGTISLPGDKSISHRSAMFSVLADGKSVVENVSDGGDVASTISILKQLGADINLDGTILTVNGKGLVNLHGKKLVLDCGNSGTSLRLFCGLLSGQNVTLVGDASLSKRPQDRVVKPLQSMNVNIKSTKGFTPVVISEAILFGGLVESEVTSAQVKSAIILAALYALSPTIYIEEILTRDHTENMLRSMGAEIESIKTDEGFQVLVRPVVEKNLRPLNGIVPGDPSSAAFFGVAACLVPGSDIVLENILGNETRIGWIKVLQRMGANIEIVSKNKVFGEEVIDIHVKYSDLTATQISKDEIPSLIDELPILALAMAKAVGTSKVRDASELRVKESDRIDVVLSHLDAMGIQATPYDDGYDIVGTEADLKECMIEPHHDHRVAMTFIIANFLATQKFETVHQDIISTSFPSFFSLFSQLID